MPYSVRELEENLVARILALNPAGTAHIDRYRQNSTAARWTEVRREGAVMTAPAEVVHLSFSVFVSSSPLADGSRGTPGDVEVVRSRVNVMFAYYLRESDAVGDRRLARDAANDLIKAVNALPHNRFIPELVNAGTIQVTDGPRPALVTLVEFDILHEIEV